jgi:hypothetical protein
VRNRVKALVKKEHAENQRRPQSAAVGAELHVRDVHRGEVGTAEKWSSG